MVLTFLPQSSYEIFLELVNLKFHFPSSFKDTLYNKETKKGSLKEGWRKRKREQYELNIKMSAISSILNLETVLYFKHAAPT